MKIGDVRWEIRNSNDWMIWVWIFSIKSWKGNKQLKWMQSHLSDDTLRWIRIEKWVVYTRCPDCWAVSFEYQLNLSFLSIMLSLVFAFICQSLCSHWYSLSSVNRLSKEKILSPFPSDSAFGLASLWDSISQRMF